MVLPGACVGFDYQLPQIGERVAFRVVVNSHDAQKRTMAVDVMPWTDPVNKENGCDDDTYSVYSSCSGYSSYSNFDGYTSSECCD